MDQTDIYSDFSSFYDLYVGGWMGDFAFYLRHARLAGGIILEIGAGTGRLTIPLAREGFSIVAVDLSPSMLALLERHLAQEPFAIRRRVHLVQADACHLNLGSRYELVIVPFYTFNYFLTDESQQAALQAIGNHLADKGKVLIDVFVPHGRIRHCPSEPVLRADTVDRQTGCKVRGWVAYTMDTTHQRETRKHLFEVLHTDGQVTKKEFTTTRRYLLKGKIEKLFAEKDFSVEAVYGDFEAKAATDASERLIYVLQHREVGSRQKPIGDVSRPTGR